ncbi:MAG: undecaprenyl-diphosphate phosphatase [Anaerolineae bacterium]|nr:undecaprenyl-diphosphate phosphatase [Anaerolineae bacterium]
MNLIQALILGLVQGATEFIPVSSSGHLVLVPWLLKWPAPGLLFDTVVHWGTLAALLAVFWRDLWQLIRAWLLSLRGRVRNSQVDEAVEADARLAWWILIGTVPAALIGWLFEEWFERLFATPAATAGFLLLTAAFLAASERWGRRHKTTYQMNLADALLVGLAQAAAIAPGISRSGATMSMGLARGLRRDDAARYAFLLATPIIFGAGLLQLLDLFGAAGAHEQLPALIIGFLAAAASGYACIRFLLRYLRRGSLYPFAAYCAVAGLAALLIAFIR